MGSNLSSYLILKTRNQEGRDENHGGDEDRVDDLPRSLVNLAAGSGCKPSNHLELVLQTKTEEGRDRVLPFL